MIDYTKLRARLAAGDWREADKETLTIMLKISDRENDPQQRLRVEDIQRFPCDDLRTINQLWLEHSEGHFGFSVQNRIWHEFGGNPNLDDKTYCRFEENLGWRVNGGWLGRHGPTIEGHFPCPWEWDAGPVVKLEVVSLLSRIQTCNL